jgi:hypothetical protein
MPEPNAIRDYDDRSELAKKRRPFHPPSDEMILAAVERAVRHDPGRRPDVSWSRFVEHLGFAKGVWSTRRLRPHAEALESAGLLGRNNRHSTQRWRLTDKGRERLDASRSSLGELPESPQHRRWREARTIAGGRIDELRQGLREALIEAADLLGAGDKTDSEAWFSMKGRLEWAAEKLARATHCLHEWAEPDDAAADIDNHWRPERRRVPRA